MERTLVLNSTYEPLLIVSWKRAIRLLFQDKVEVVAEYERHIHSVSLKMRLPSVLRLQRYVKHHRFHRHVKFTRSNLYARDRYCCQYCGNRRVAQDLTYDHVLPVSKGGEKSWENIVTCCVSCNRRKGSRTPNEAGLRLMKAPQAPAGFPQKVYLVLSQAKAPDSWHSYIFS